MSKWKIFSKKTFVFFLFLHKKSTISQDSYCKGEWSAVDKLLSCMTRSFPSSSVDLTSPAFFTLLAPSPFIRVWVRILLSFSICLRGNLNFFIKDSLHAFERHSRQPTDIPTSNKRFDQLHCKLPRKIKRFELLYIKTLFLSSLVLCQACRTMPQHPN